MKTMILPSIKNCDMVALEEVTNLNIRRGSVITQKSARIGTIPVVAGGMQPAYYNNQSNRRGNVITISGSGYYAGFANFFECPIYASDCTTIESLDEKKVCIKFIYNILKLNQNKLYALKKGANVPHVHRKDIVTIKVPLPPIKVQNQIAETIAKWDEMISLLTKHIDVCQRQKTGMLQQFMAKKLKKAPESKLGDIDSLNIQRGEVITEKEAQLGAIPVIAGGMQPAYYHNKSNRKGNVITISGSGYAGFVNFFECPIHASDCTTIESLDEKKVRIKFVYNILKLHQNKLYALKKGGNVPHVHKKDIVTVKIPLPSIRIQQEIVLTISQLDKYIDLHKQLLDRYKLQRKGIMQNLLS